MTTEAMQAYLGGADLRITIRHLRALNGGVEMSVGILIESGMHREQKNLLIRTEQYCEWKLTRGEISEELYEQLEEASALCHALRQGEHLLSYGANTRKMLSQKLSQRGYSREIAERAAERLTEMGLLDEAADLKREVEKCLRKLWGKGRITSHLWSKGFQNDVMELLPDLLEGVCFEDNCAALIQKHYDGVPKEPSEHRRMVASLSRYGYSLSEIKNAVRICSKETVIKGR